MRIHDVIVIGAGLFGQTIAKTLRHQGRTVMVVDAQLPGSGSRPAACIMKPSWYESLGTDIHTPGLDLLDEVYGLKSITFEQYPTARAKSQLPKQVRAHWVNPQDILRGGPVKHAEAAEVAPNLVVLTDQTRLSARLVVVAAGVWVEELLPQFPQQSLKGISFFWPKTPTTQPNFIHPYAPYRQFMTFGMNGGIWAGDGTAILQKNWTDKRELRSYQRAMHYVGNRTKRGENYPCKWMTGLRPYASKIHKRPCIVGEVSPGLWVATGGAKNGTVLAGYAAYKIREETG